MHDRSGLDVLLLGLLQSIVKLILLGSIVHLISQFSLLLHHVDSRMQIHSLLGFVSNWFWLRLKAIWVAIHADTLHVWPRLGHLSWARLLNLLVLTNLGDKLRDQIIL